MHSTKRKRPAGQTQLASFGKENDLRRGGLRRAAEDARGLALLLLRLFLLGVRRDDRAVDVRRDLAALVERLELLGVERLALEERLRDLLDALLLLREEE